VIEPKAEEPSQEPSRVVAAFDFDGTLTRGGSVWQFLVALVGPLPVAVAASVLVVKLVRAALFGGSAADEAKEALFTRTLAGLDIEDVSRRAEAFGLAHYRRRARPDVNARLEWHRSQGHLLVIVSASLDLYVSAVGRELKVDEVVATALEVTPQGILTGRYDGKNCRGSEKLLRVEKWMGTSTASDEPPEGPDAARLGTTNHRTFLWAYGNSAGDAALLAAADVGVDAGRLGRLGKLRRFTRLADLERKEGSLGIGS
jgi:HAD superfamily hydrolase (TIGR01490 family)